MSEVVSLRQSRDVLESHKVDFALQRQSSQKWHNCGLTCLNALPYTLLVCLQQDDNMSWVKLAEQSLNQGDGT